MNASAGTSAALDGLSDEDRATYETFTAIADPVERAAAITAWGRLRGTLRQPFSGLRRDALAAAREHAIDNGHKLSWVARKVGFSGTRFTRLSKTTATEAAA